ncbi:methylglutaconyl-CoA hydratase [Pseudomonas duriflava]|uniref:Methylglutaconyl-CoA hydratase n=1 Tax=Pseudomonas duriflava TaxID=459528 RepID=A0A562Q916_9PSED|nr:gamma-carboxygeranoyl-CoA hydratase [Pseudomonas duriflava]TWI52670.1 methylglutaconyl-CoA hydratase [Pseudomonas duriflava]
MTYQTLQFEQDINGVATLWLNRPDKNNAFNADVIAELIQALDEIYADESIRLVILRGRGRHFSSGADLAWMQASAQLTLEENRADARLLSQLMEKLYHLPQPSLAVVQGAAFGGALGLVACCDMAIGAQDAMFCLSEVRIGLAPAVISPYVVRAIGERATRRYALTAERFSGEKAQSLGLLAETYPADQLEQAVNSWTGTLLLNSPAALKACKALLHDVGAAAVLDDPIRERTQHCIAMLRVSPEGQEGLRAFLEKRTPAWQENIQ